MLINDLSAHLGVENNCALYTGTFDPPHLGHSKVIEETFASEFQPNSLVVVPHNWNEGKKPAPLEKRINWLIQSIREFNPSIAPKIRVCSNEELAANKILFDMICSNYSGRIVRVLGGDKETLISRSTSLRIVVVPRNLPSSSTLIRAAVKEENVESVRSLIAKEVLQDILEGSWY